MSEAAELFALITGGGVPQALAVVARLGIADLLGGGQRSAPELAAATGTHPGALHRVLRALSCHGIFALDAEDRFSLLPLGQLLRRDLPGSMAAAAIASLSPWRQAAWAALEHSVRTGESAFGHVFGTDLFTWLGEHPEAAQGFYEGHTSLVALTDDAVLQSVDFSRFRQVVDVAGGEGRLLTRILAENPQTTGVLFDLPSGIAAARAAVLASAAGVADRMQMVVGDVFEGLPAGADAYLFQRFLHGWDDRDAQRILERCREVIAPDGRVILVEAVVVPNAPRSLGVFFDLEMMVVAEGRARTEAEHRALLAAAGFELVAVVETGTPFSVIEAVVA